jgi:LAS superfamily LD-carboxypeptidase LdcB
MNDNGIEQALYWSGFPAISRQRTGLQWQIFGTGNGQSRELTPSIS